MRIRYAGERLQHGVTRTQLTLLQHPGNAFGFKCRAHLLGAVPVDHVDRIRRKLPRCVDYVLQQRAPGKRLQDLWPVGLHPLALAGCENDDRKRHARAQPRVLRSRWIILSCAATRASSASACA